MSDSILTSLKLPRERVRGEGRIAQLDLTDSKQLDHDLKFRTFRVTMRSRNLDDVTLLARAGANRDEKWERGCQC